MFFYCLYCNVEKSLFTRVKHFIQGTHLALGNFFKAGSETAKTNKHIKQLFPYNFYLIYISWQSSWPFSQVFTMSFYLPCWPYLLQVNLTFSCLTRYTESTVKTEAQLLPPSAAVKEEEIDPLEGQEELGIFQILDKLEEVTEFLLNRWIIIVFGKVTEALSPGELLYCIQK